MLAFVFDRTDSKTFSVYLNGNQLGVKNNINQNFASHSGDNGIGFAP